MRQPLSLAVAQPRCVPGDARGPEVDGWRIGVGICRDTGIGDHVERMAALDIDVWPRRGPAPATWPGPRSGSGPG